MAKASRAEKYTKATIDMSEGTVTEVLKDDINIYHIADILKRWDKIENINISFSTDDEIPCVSDV